MKRLEIYTSLAYFRLENEMTQTATYLITRETIGNHRNYKCNFSHCGGISPYVAYRVAQLSVEYSSNVSANNSVPYLNRIILNYYELLS